MNRPQEQLSFDLPQVEGFPVLVEFVKPWRAFQVGEQYYARENTALECWSLMGTDGRLYGLCPKWVVKEVRRK